MQKAKIIKHRVDRLYPDKENFTEGVWRDEDDFFISYDVKNRVIILGDSLESKAFRVCERLLNKKYIIESCSKLIIIQSELSFIGNNMIEIMDKEHNIKYFLVYDGSFEIPQFLNESHTDLRKMLLFLGVNNSNSSGTMKPKGYNALVDYAPNGKLLTEYIFITSDNCLSSIILYGNTAQMEAEGISKSGIIFGLNAIKINTINFCALEVEIQSADIKEFTAHLFLQLLEKGYSLNDLLPPAAARF